MALSVAQRLEAQRNKLVAEQGRAQAQGQPFDPGPEAPPLVPNTHHGRNVIRAGSNPVEGHIDGIPLDQMTREQMDMLASQARAELAEEEATGTQLTDEDIAERKREALRIKLEAAKTQGVLSDPQMDPDVRAESLLLTDPVPETGDFMLDNRGRSVYRPGARRGSTSGKPTVYRRDIPNDFEYDSREALILQRAEEGVDFRRGLPFVKRMRAAFSSNIPSARARAWTNVLHEEIANVPEGIAPVQYDPALGQIFVASQVSEEDVELGFEKAENIGKFRYIAVDEAGLALEDIADLLNPAEIGSFAASMMSPGKVGFFKRTGYTGAAATVGRIGGEILSIANDVWQSGGEWIPTTEELAELGFSAAMTETLFSFLGEGFGVALRKGIELPQEAYALAMGKHGVYGSKTDVMRANVDIQATKQDLERVQTITGESDYAVTPGTAAKSIDMVEMENSRRKNARPAKKREYQRQDAVNARAEREYMDRIFSGDIRVLQNKAGTVQRANRAMDNEGIIVAQMKQLEGSDETIVAFVMKDSPDNGVKVAVNPDNWQVRGAHMEPELRGTGIIDDLYETAGAEARAHGKPLASDTTVSSDAMKVWERQAGKDNFEELVWNPNVERIGPDLDGRYHYVSQDGRPVVQVKPMEPIAEEMLGRYLQAAPNAQGRIQARKEFGEILRRGGRSELGMLQEEAANNRLVRQQVQDAIHLDYVSKTQKADGSWSQKGFEEWKAETLHNVEKFFSPEEMSVIRQRGGLTAVVEKNRASTQLIEETLQKQFNLSPIELRNPKSKAALYKQLSAMDQVERRRAMALLDRADMGHGIRNILKQDIHDLWYPTIAAGSGSFSTAAKFNGWIRENAEIIRDLFPGKQGQMYVTDLLSMGRIVERRAMQSGIKGVMEEANPSIVAFTRVAFGPLSRAQRFISAGRRFQTRMMGERAADLISDPEQLRLLMQIRSWPLASRRAGQALSRLGVSPDWFEEGGDWEDPEFRQRFADNIANLQLISDQVSE